MRKSDAVLSILRSKITGGEWRPGNRLPTRRLLQANFGISAQTVLRVLARLESESLIEKRPRGGCYVRGVLPSTSSYGVLLTGGKHELESHYYRSLKHAFNAYSESHPLRCVEFFVRNDSNPISSDMCRLLDKVEKKLLAGVVVFPSYMDFCETVLDQSAGFPSVAIQSGSARSYVVLEVDDFYSAAFEAVAAAGARRPAVILQSDNLSAVDFYKRYYSRAVECGLAFPRRFLIHCGCQPLDWGWVSHPVELLMHLPRDQRPDSFVIADDNVVPEVTRTLAELGCVGKGVGCVVAHTNFPYPSSAFVPVVRIGFSLDQVAECCFWAIDDQRLRGECCLYRIGVATDDGPGMVVREVLG